MRSLKEASNVPERVDSNLGVWMERRHRSFWDLEWDPKRNLIVYQRKDNNLGIWMERRQWILWDLEWDPEEKSNIDSSLPKRGKGHAWFRDMDEDHEIFGVLVSGHRLRSWKGSAIPCTPSSRLLARRHCEKQETKQRRGGARNRAPWRWMSTRRSAAWRKRSRAWDFRSPMAPFLYYPSPFFMFLFSSYAFFCPANSTTISRKRSFRVFCSE
jgi:hypothetical protein